MDTVPRPRMRDAHRDAHQTASSGTDAELGIKHMISPFQSYRPASGWPAWCLVAGGAYVLLMCVFAGIGLGTLIATRNPLMSITTVHGVTPVGVPSVQQSTRFETGSVKVSVLRALAIFAYSRKRSRTKTSSIHLECINTNSVHRPLSSGAIHLVLSWNAQTIQGVATHSPFEHDRCFSALISRCLRVYLYPSLTVGLPCAVS